MKKNLEKFLFGWLKSSNTASLIWVITDVYSVQLTTCSGMKNQLYDIILFQLFEKLETKHKFDSIFYDLVSWLLLLLLIFVFLHQKSKN